MAASQKAERLRIALVSDSAPPVANGVASSMASLARELVRRGHDVLMAGPAFGRVESPGDVITFPAWPAPGLPNYPLARPFIGAQARRIADWQPDVVHTQTPFCMGLAGAAAARRAGARHVSTFHTLYDLYTHYARAPKGLGTAAMRAYCRWFYGRCAALATPSEFSRGHLVGCGVAGPIQVIPTGIDMPFHADRDGARSQLGARPGSQILLTVGRLAREKSFSMVLSAAARSLPERGEVWLVGDGPERSRLEIEAHHLGLRARFWGAAPRRLMPMFYAAADAFAFASTTETQGLVVQEAMSHGLPVACVRGGAASEAVEEHGCGAVVEPRADALAAGIRRALGPEGCAWAERARAGARQFSMERMGDACEALYRS